MLPAKVPLWKLHAMEAARTRTPTRAPGNGPHKNESWQTHARDAFPGSSNTWHLSINNNKIGGRRNWSSKAKKSNKEREEITNLKVVMDRQTQQEGWKGNHIRTVDWIHL